ncbi:MAG TPA: PKD domain-containing protein [Chitinophagales bacterium]|nr:PKD domain-containing protein [Chitinophagales bacterium]
MDATVHAEHLTGGEMRYSYVKTLGDGKQVYEITVRIYRDALGGGATFDNPLNITIFNLDNSSYRNKSIRLYSSGVSTLPLNDLGPCAKQVPDVKIDKAVYTFLDTVALNGNGYMYAHQRCCRPSNITNLGNPGNQGSTYNAHLTRAAMLANNSNPTFKQEPPLLVCIRSNFEYQFAATDVDGNTLKYSLCEPFIGGNNNTNSGVKPVTASRPPYTPVEYATGHTPTQPLGKDVEVILNPNTGLLSFSPEKLGIYTLAVCVEEFDASGQSIGLYKRDIQFNVADCIVATAKASINAAEPVEGVYASCKGQTIKFRNKSLDAQSYFWDFGIDGIDSDTSTLKEPTYTFPDSGSYNITLIINKGQTCVDTSIITLRVYPVLDANFTYQVTCENNPVKFLSTSTSTVDPIIKQTWTYDNNKISTAKTFNYTFPSIGPYPVQILVETLNGCKDSISQSVSIPDFTPSEFKINGLQQSQPDRFVICNNNREAVLTNLTPPSTSSLWKIGAFTSTSHDLNYVFPDTGSYKIDLIVNPGTDCEDKSTQWVRILPEPQADFTFKSDCQKFPVEFFTNMSRTFDQVQTASWKFGDGKTSSLINPINDYKTVKDYTVSLNITTAAGCTDNITKTISVFPNPKAEFNITGEQQAGKYIRCDNLLAVDFADNSINATTYQWVIGNNLSQPKTKNAQFIFPDTGKYDIRLTVNPGKRCADDTVKSIQVIDGITKVDFKTNNVCVKTNQTFTNSSVTVKNDVKSYNWSFGDNTFSTLKSPVKNYTLPGTYTVKLVVETLLGCKDSLEKIITIYPAPKANFTNSDACLNALKTITNTSTISSGTIKTYSWNLGTLGNSSDVSPLVTFKKADDYYISLIATSDFGCKDSITKTITTREASQPNFEYTNQCFAAPVYFKDLSKSKNNDIVSYIWQFEPGESGTGKSPNHTFSTFGKISVQLMTVTSFGCKDSITKTITLKNIPKANFNVAGNTANSVTLFNCTKDYSVQFNNTSTKQVDYLWNFGIAGSTSTEENPLFVFPDTGIYVVTLTLELGTACQNIIQKSVRILPPVTSSFTHTTECVKAPVFFKSVANRPYDPIKTFDWDFGDGTSSDEKNPSKVYKKSGDYTVTLTVTANSGCQHMSSKTITVAPAPIADFVTDGIEKNNSYLKCENLLAVSFVNNSISNATNNWSFTDLNQTSTQVSPQYTFSEIGTFPVTLVINQGKICGDTITKNVKVINGIEKVDFTFKNDCALSEIEFTNKSVAVLKDFNSYVWDFGDGSSSLQKDPVKKYNNPGTYTVTLTAKTALGCVESVSKQITIYPIPKALFDVSQVCLNQALDIQNLSTILTGKIKEYEWDLGDQQVSSDINPSITFSEPGFFEVTLIATSDFGCVDEIKDSIEVRTPSIPDFTFSNICLKAPVEFKDQTQSIYNDIQNWEWEVLPNTVITGKNPSYTFPKDGEYLVKLMVTTTLGCRDSISKTITVRPQPIADFITDAKNIGGNNFVICDDIHLVSFTNQSTDNSTNLWSFGTFGSSTEASPIYTYADTGRNIVTLTINSGSLCTDSKSIQLDVLPDLKVDFDYTLACEKNSITFNDLSTTILNDIFRWNWSMGDSTIYTAQNIEHTYEEKGIYPIKLLVSTKRGCVDSTTKDFQVFSLPIVDFDFQEACPQQLMTIKNNSKAADKNKVKSYEWDLGNGTTSTLKNPKVQYNAPGPYEIKLSVLTEAGCKDSISDFVIVRDFVQPIIQQSQEIYCIEKDIIFDASSSKGVYQNYFWEFGDGGVSEQKIDTTSFQSEGIYTIHLTLKDSLCGSFDTISTIEIITIPEVRLGDDFALCPNLTTPILLDYSYPYDSIVWNTGEKNENPITVKGTVGTVAVEVYYKGCVESDSLEVIANCDVLVPQVFTPNGDGKNDFFNLLSSNVQSFQLFVYNRWGTLIFSTDDLKNGWDGTYQGKLQPMDNYTYYAVGTKVDGSDFTIQGSILLLR